MISMFSKNIKGDNGFNFLIGKVGKNTSYLLTLKLVKLVKYIQTNSDIHVNNNKKYIIISTTLFKIQQHIVLIRFELCYLSYNLSYF